MKKFFLPLSVLLLVAACGRGESDADAWGTFEADEVIISSETSGRILTMDVD